jgi:hypothetical protein
MALNIVAIAHSIASLSISGVTVHDIHDIPTTLTERDCPAFFPNPDGFVTGLQVTRDSMGLANTARKTVTYTLHYVYCHAPIGEGRGLFDIYSAFVTNAFAIIDAIIANDALSGALDMTVTDAANFGPVNDPAGNVFHGCEFALDIMELVN